MNLWRTCTCCGKLPGGRRELHRKPSFSIGSGQADPSNEFRVSTEATRWKTLAPGLPQIHNPVTFGNMFHVEHRMLNRIQRMFHVEHLFHSGRSFNEPRFDFKARTSNCCFEPAIGMDCACGKDSPMSPSIAKSASVVNTASQPPIANQIRCRTRPPAPSDRPREEPRNQTVRPDSLRARQIPSCSDSNCAPLPGEMPPSCLATLPGSR